MRRSVAGAGEPEPSTVAGPALLELGEDIGAAVIYAEGAHDGAELEIKREGSEWNGHHTAIRPRASGRPGNPPVYAGLFFGLPAGRYELRLRGKPLGEVATIEVVGGQIAALDLIG